MLGGGIGWRYRAVKREILRSACKAAALRMTPSDKKPNRATLKLRP